MKNNADFQFIQKKFFDLFEVVVHDIDLFTHCGLAAENS